MRAWRAARSITSARLAAGRPATEPATTAAARDRPVTTPPARPGGPKPGGGAAWTEGPVADVDHGEVADQVDLEHDRVPPLGGQQPFQGTVQLGPVGVGDVQGQELPVGAGAEAGVVDGVHDRHQHDRRRGGDPAGGGPEAVDQPQGQGDEVVGDLFLGDLVRAQPDDRQDPEQAQPEPDAGLGAGEHGGDGQHPDVQRDIGQQQVTAVVAAEVDAIGEQGDRGQVAREPGQQGDGGWHGGAPRSFGSPSHMVRSNHTLRFVHHQHAGRR
jgi:hypothetical protein